MAAITANYRQLNNMLKTIWFPLWLQHVIFTYLHLVFWWKTWWSPFFLDLCYKGHENYTCVSCSEYLQVTLMTLGSLAKQSPLRGQKGVVSHGNLEGIHFPQKKQGKIDSGGQKKACSDLILLPNVVPSPSYQRNQVLMTSGLGGQSIDLKTLM